MAEKEVTEKMYKLVSMAPEEVIQAAFLAACSALSKIASGEIDTSDMPTDPNKIGIHILEAVTDGLLEKMLAQKAASVEADKAIRKMMN